MTENKSVEVTDILTEALALSLEMTNPEKYNVLNKKEVAFIHHNLDFFSEYEEKVITQKIRNILISSREMILYNIEKGKKISKSELEFMKMIESLSSELKVSE